MTSHRSDVISHRSRALYTCNPPRCWRNPAVSCARKRRNNRRIRLPFSWPSSLSSRLRKRVVRYTKKKSRDVPLLPHRVEKRTVVHCGEPTGKILLRFRNVSRGTSWLTSRRWEISHEIYRSRTSKILRGTSRKLKWHFPKTRLPREMNSA